MPAFLTPLSFIITAIAEWLNQHQTRVSTAMTSGDAVEFLENY